MTTAPKTLWGSVLLAGGLAVSGFAIEPAVPVFNTGDTVAFIGDSITHGGSYHADIFLFYATRFPDKELKYYNCGSGGDTAKGTLTRFDRDIAIHYPNVATIMLGMNDVGLKNFDRNKTSPADIAIQNDSFKVYRESMDSLAAKLTGIGCRIIFITPSIYDQTAELETPSCFGADDGLVRFAGYMDTLAAKYNGSVVDFHSIMARVNRKLQAANPAFTIVGPDRTHPGDPGHLLMAYAFLRAQQMPKYVSSIGIDAAAAKTTQTVNCEVGQIHSVAPDGIGFSCRELALPFPVSKAQQPALGWVPFQQELNQQVLTVKNLAPGTYTLKIDGMPVATYSAGELDQGVNLADNPNTPQYKQALAVKAITDKIHYNMTRLRAIFHVRYVFLKDCNPIPEDDGVLRQVFDKILATHQGGPVYDHLKRKFDEYIKIHRSENDFRQQVEILFGEVGKVNKPSAHQWAIIPAGGS